MARRFEFKLEALLDIRLRAEKKEQLAYAQIMQEVEAIKRQIRQLEQAIVDQNRTLTAEKLIGTLDLAYIANEKRFVSSMHMLIVQTMQKLAQIEQRAAVQKVKLLATSKARKVIDKLKEKQQSRWRQDQEMKEAAVTDELGTQLALRNAIDAELESLWGDEA